MDFAYHEGRRATTASVLIAGGEGLRMRTLAATRFTAGRQLSPPTVAAPRVPLPTPDILLSDSER